MYLCPVAGDSLGAAREGGRIQGVQGEQRLGRDMAWGSSGWGHFTTALLGLVLKVGLPSVPLQVSLVHLLPPCIPPGMSVKTRRILDSMVRTLWGDRRTPGDWGGDIGDWVGELEVTQEDRAGIYR